MIEHPVFARPVGDDRIILITVVDKDTLPAVKEDCFIFATTGTNLYMGKHPAMTLNMDSIIDTKEYAKIADDEDTIGNSITGILRKPYWFIRKFKSLIEQLG
jgi:hypothetical protein